MIRIITEDQASTVGLCEVIGNSNQLFSLPVATAMANRNADRGTPLLCEYTEDHHGWERKRYLPLVSVRNPKGGAP